MAADVIRGKGGMARLTTPESTIVQVLGGVIHGHVTQRSPRTCFISRIISSVFALSRLSLPILNVSHWEPGSLASIPQTVARQVTLPSVKWDHREFYHTGRRERGV